MIPFTIPFGTWGYLFIFVKGHKEQMHMRKPSSSKNIAFFFHPRSIAVVGASANPEKIGGRTYRFLRDNQFSGPLYPINPTHPVVQGDKTYASLVEVPEEIDLAFVIVPAKLAPQAMETCVRKGVRAAVIFSSGFAEVDAAGKALQARMLDIAREGNVRVMGPNCMGVVNLRRGLLGTFSSSIDYYRPQAGTVGVISQSGAVGVYCLALAHKKKMGVSLWATTGNSMDVDVAEVLEYMAYDENTKVIMAYLEGVTTKEPLERALAAAKQQKKPVVMLKVGRSELGAKAAASHTASLAGTDAMYDALFATYGVHRAKTLDELMDISHACARGVFPKTNRVGLITISGGVGVIMADDAADLNLNIPETPEALQQKFKALLPYAAVGNPVDITAQALSDIHLVEKNLELMLSEGNYDSIVFFLATVGISKTLMKQLEKPLIALRKRFPKKPLLLSCLWDDEEVIRPYEEAGFQLYQDPTRAMECLAAMVHFARIFQDKTPAKPLPLASGALAPPHHGINEYQAKRILASAGIPSLSETLVQSAEEAANTYQQWGVPLAMKIVSPDILHKTEVDGVLLNVQSAKEAQTGFVTLMKRAQQAKPQAKLDGVLMSPMVFGGVETILGVTRDAVFGPVVMFGLGGVFVEVFHDIVFRLAPFGEEEAMQMVNSIQAAPLLHGVRGRPKMNVEALAQALSRLSIYAHTHQSSLESIDINPFVVLPKGTSLQGHGALALDALIEAATGRTPASVIQPIKSQP